MEMQRRTVQRGIVALAIVTSLSVAGSRPAAAANLGLLNRLDQIWSIVTGSPSPAAPRATSRPSRLPGKSTPPPPTIDRGWGIDPNGSRLAPDLPVPTVNG
jgi:hypothetical protein